MANVSLGEYWEAMKTSIANQGKESLATLKDFQSIPSRASDIAEANFPNSSRDSSKKNAFRHALGTGMLTNALGGNRVSALAAKGLGYLWEGFGTPDYFNSQAKRTDSLHDLNANAIGARVATQSKGQQELEDSLRQLALGSKKVNPPGVFSPSPGYMTHTEK